MKAATTKTTTVTQRFTVEFETEGSLEKALIMAAKNALSDGGTELDADVPDSAFRISFDVSSSGYLRGALVELEVSTTEATE